MTWLLRRDVAEQFSRFLARDISPTAEQLDKFAGVRASRRSSGGGMPDIMTVAGDVAEIRIEGLLTEKPDFWAWLFYGNTAYEDIRTSLALAGSDSQVKRAQLLVASPGGYTTGLFDTLAALEAFSKPITTRASLAASAAYALASFGGKIEATSIAAEFGSIGVAAQFWVDEHVIDIASSGAPNKRPDVTTPEGQAIVRAELDAIEEIFVDAIARGRGTTSKLVLSDFGRGGVFLANEAKKRGMIDRVHKAAASGKSASATPTETEQPASAPSASVSVPAAIAASAPTSTPSAPEGGEAETRHEPPPSPRATGEGTNTMATRAEFQAQNPADYAAIQNEAMTAERERVTAHLQMGESSGAMAVAIAAINAGTPFSHAPTQASYMSAILKRNDQASHAADSAGAAAAVNGTAPAAAAGDLGDAVAAILVRENGGLPPSANASTRA